MPLVSRATINSLSPYQRRRERKMADVRYQINNEIVSLLELRNRLRDETMLVIFEISRMRSRAIPRTPPALSITNRRT